jgi:hypothetical protein
LAVALAVVGAVGEHLLGAELAITAPRRHTVHEREQLGDVMTVCRGHGRGERDPVAAADQVMLAARPGAVDG